MHIDEFNKLSNDEKLKLNNLYIEGNNQPINLSYCSNLLSLQIFDLFDIDLKHCPLLHWLDINSEIHSFNNISICTNLFEVRINNTLITSIDFSCNSGIYLIDMSYNALETIVLPPNVEMLHLNHNRFTQIDISCPILKILHIDDNPLHTLNLTSSCPLLTDLTAENTMLSSIDLRNCLGLVNVMITGTHIFKYIHNGPYDDFHSHVNDYEDYVDDYDDINDVNFELT